MVSQVRGVQRMKGLFRIADFTKCEKRMGLHIYRILRIKLHCTEVMNFTILLSCEKRKSNSFSSK